jgi:hypothetical protein
MTRLANIRHVRQKHAMGCVIASLAMIGGMEYDEVAALYAWFDAENGIEMDTVSYDFLWFHDFACQPVYPYRPGPPIRGTIEECDRSREARRRAPWPPLPWAEAHLCQVVMPGGAHCVVMLADGSVLDPLTEQPKRLTEYEQVYNVRGVFDIRASGR